MRVMAIVGSPRAGGNTNFLVQEALNEIGRAGIETEKVTVSEQKIDPCLGHDDCGMVPACHLVDDMGLVLQRFLTADGIILGSPTFFGNVSGQMKIFIDRNRFYYRQQKKIAARSAGIIVVANNSGTESTRDALKRFLRSVSDVPQDRILVAMGLTKPPMAARSNAALIEEARALGRQMARELRQVSP
ncbi:MAG: flavodoxin family protein [Chloroflexi bacterium]|nr:flavodoxin family protein [Chloroflexota bacterium]